MDLENLLPALLPLAALLVIDRNSERKYNARVAIQKIRSDATVKVAAETGIAIAQCPNVEAKDLWGF